MAFTLCTEHTKPKIKKKRRREFHKNKQEKTDLKIGIDCRFYMVKDFVDMQH